MAEAAPTQQQPVVTVGDTPNTGAPAVDDPYLPPGMQIGEYKIESKIGEGGMGVVYAAVHPLIGKRAAVKVLKAELCRSQFNVERFVDEARIVNRIGHPNIVDVFAFGLTPDGRSYFVMEWLKGETLRERIARARLDLPEVCEVVRPLARALEAAHEQGVIHRDLKPDNIFLVDVRGDAPLVKLLDFGIAKLTREEHRMERTATGAMVGTPLYIAPEQAKGYAIDHGVDIYALGGILFELLTGRTAFVADNAMEIVAKHLMEPPPRPSLFAHVPPELDDLVVRMLAKDPAARPTLAEVATVIERTAALDRTNVKLSAPRAGAAEPPRSEPIAIMSTSAVRTPVTPLPSLHAPPPTSEAIGAARSPNRRARMLLLALLFPGAATVAFVTASMVGGPEERLEVVTSRPPPVTVATPPAVETPPPVPPSAPVAPSAPIAVPEPAPEPVATEPPPDAATKPKVAKPKLVAKPSVKKPAKPASEVKPGRIELQIVGATGTPQIRVDGKLVSGPAFTIAPGSHTVTVTSPRMKARTLTVQVGEAETKNVKVELEPIVTKDGLMEPGSVPAP